MSKLLGVLVCGSVCLVLGLGTTGCTKKTEKEKTVEKKTTTTGSGGTETKTETKESKTSSTGTGTGTGTTATGKFTLTAPADVTVTQGETAKVHVAITRDKLNDAVNVNITDLPKGVTVEGANHMIAKDAAAGDFTLKAAADATPVENHVSKVSASSGTVTHDATFKVTVKKK